MSDVPTSSVVGSMLAFAVGDALGWPIEGRGSRVGGTKDLKPELVFHEWRRREGGGYAPREEVIPTGSYSDDTQLMLAVARSVRRSDWWTHLTRTELPWWTQYQLGGGGATRRATQAWAKGNAPWKSTDPQRYWQAGGNGAAMRILAHTVGPDFELVRDRVLADGAATHGHPIALAPSQAYAYALWLTLRRREPLGWGQLLDEVLAGVGLWAQFNPDVVPDDWAQHLSDDYSEQWSRTIDGLIERLKHARNQLAHGALAVDDRVLDELGAYSKESGAGTVTVAATLYLASRHAADPRQGLLRAAFAHRADTDTLAAMTGALLGAVHGPDWLGPTAEKVMDARLLQRTAETLGQPDGPPTEPYGRNAVRHVETELAQARPGTRTHLPFYGDVEVTSVRDLDNQTSRIRSWWMSNTDGQTFRVTRTSKAKRSPWIRLETAEPSSPHRDEPRLRSGLVVSVQDLSRSREFYESLLGMAVSRTTRSALVLNGWLALEPAINGTARIPAYDAPATVTLYAEPATVAATKARLEKAGVQLTVAETERGLVVRTHDPDGVPVEVRAN
jgi:ADP-ribosylglycohydrolase/catechol 2,3-dioxygenase-like lactoylglutathione lyase family enzyme